jgi:hypothetical protein
MNLAATMGFSYSNSGLMVNADSKNLNSSSAAFLGIEANILMLVFFFFYMIS